MWGLLTRAIQLALYYTKKYLGAFFGYLLTGPLVLDRAFSRLIQFLSETGKKNLALNLVNSIAAIGLIGWPLLVALWLGSPRLMFVGVMATSYLLLKNFKYMTG
jgi:hypothetical protein